MARVTILRCILLLLASACWPAYGSAAAPKDGKSTLARAVHLDAAPLPESGAPDPLAPAEVDGPAPLAPGAPAGAASSEAVEGASPVVAAVRQKLAARTSPRAPGDRADLAGALAYYATAASALWVGEPGFTARGQQALDEIRKADDWGLKASAFDVPAAIESGATAEALADAEIRVALAVLKYARHARGGRLEPLSVSRKFDQKPALFQPRSVLQGIAGAEDAAAYLRGLHPQHPQFERLRQALVALRQAKAEGAAGSAGKGASTTQLIVNMERWRWMPPELGAFHVWDSIPDQIASVVHDGKVIFSEKIVVGKLSSPTPVFSAGMQFVIFHPSWGVPPGMKSYELAPQLRNTGGGGWFSSKPLASSVLRSHGLNVTRGGVPVDPDSVDWSKVDIRSFEFTQPPGPTNVLGVVKFRFPNKHDVYMHDTPERHLFGGAVRAFSHGCMRVQNPIRLAEVLLAHDKGWSVEKVREQARRGGEVVLTTQIPVHVTYFTVTVDDAGTVVTRPDLYGLDSRVASALEGREVAIAGATGVPESKPRPIAAKRPGNGRVSQAPKEGASPTPFNFFGSFAN